MSERFVAIVDYDLGNLFSVQQACKKTGLKAVITDSRDDIYKSSGIILTGVGAFSKAMEILVEKKLVEALGENILSGKPLLGICLGMQILMTESCEFGQHAGLDIIKGKVMRLKTGAQNSKNLKVPHVGWNHICSSSGGRGSDNFLPPEKWKGTLLEGIPDGTQMYFVHSYFVAPSDCEVILSTTYYGDNLFCSSLHFKSITAFQFHPECSGPNGLMIYSNFAKQILKTTGDDVCLKKLEKK